MGALGSNATSLCLENPETEPAKLSTSALLSSFAFGIVILGSDFVALLLHQVIEKGIDILQTCLRKEQEVIITAKTEGLQESWLNHFMRMKFLNNLVNF
ncbi:hypothetical protein ACJX0J_009743, partial [Zea mays]